MNLEHEIQAKRAEIRFLTEMLDNAKRDLRKLEQRKEESYGEDSTK